MLKNVNFELSVFSKDKLLNTNLPQIVLVGKSNVGKSSFINTICNRKNLAKVGQTPGKTKCLNYYNVNNEFYIVDLPGYGYSTMSEKEKQTANKLVDFYLRTNENIKHIFFLVDIRHKPTANDRLMYEFLLSTNIHFTIIATKSDKIAKTKIDDYIKIIRKSLFAKENILSFSSSNKDNLENITKVIENIIYNN